MSSPCFQVQNWVPKVCPFHQVKKRRKNVLSKSGLVKSQLRGHATAREPVYTTTWRLDWHSVIAPGANYGEGGLIRHARSINKGEKDECTAPRHSDGEWLDGGGRGRCVGASCLGSSASA